MRELTVEEVRDIQLELFKKFDKYCRENNIRYFVGYGTLLGAVRHKGFIPWDNDIDVLIPRTEYDRLIELLKDDDANEDFRLLCYENDKNYLYPHGRISDKGTYIKTAGGYKKFGISVDLFPMDNQGDSIKEAEKNFYKVKDYTRLRIFSYDKKYKTLKIPDYDWKVKLKYRIMLAWNQEQSHWVEKTINQQKIFNNGGRQTRYYGYTGAYCPAYEKEIFADTVYLDFEDMKVPAPVGYELFLTKTYGDYMTPPPEDKRRKMKNTVVYKL